MTEEPEGEQNPRSSYGIKGFFRSKSAVLTVALAAAFILIFTVGPVRSAAGDFLANMLDTAQRTFAPKEVYIGEVSLDKSVNPGASAGTINSAGVMAVKRAAPVKPAPTMDSKDKQISALNDKINALQAQLDAAAKNIAVAPTASSAPAVPQVTNSPVIYQSPPPPAPIQVSVPVGDKKVLVSEIMAGADGNSNYEFIELYNAGSSAVDLTGWSVKKKSSTGSESSLVAASRLSGKTIQPGHYFLLGNENGYQGSAALDVPWPSSYILAYVNNSVVLYDNGVKVEEIFWAEIPKDRSFARMDWNGSQFVLSTSPSPRNSTSSQ